MRQRAWAIVFAIVAASLGARCTGTKASDKPGQPADGGAVASAPAGNACDRRLVTQEDVAGLLRDPIASMKSLAADGDPQTCTFETAGFATVSISLRPGLGNTTVDAWVSGRMPLRAEPLAGVGDRAAWCPELHEVIATRHNVLCDIAVGGPPSGAVANDEVKRRLGELCNKLFARSS